MTPHAVADQASFSHAAEFFNSLLGLPHVLVRSDDLPLGSRLVLDYGSRCSVKTGAKYFHS